MPLKLFTEIVCPSGEHCQTCRDPQRNATLFVSALNNGVLLHADLPEVCPSGKPIGYIATPKSACRLVDLSCVHRGSKVGEVKCPTCVGEVKIHVLACKEFGKCTIETPVAGVTAVCATCQSRRSTI